MDADDNDDDSDNDEDANVVAIAQNQARLQMRLLSAKKDFNEKNEELAHIQERENAIMEKLGIEDDSPEDTVAMDDLLTEKAKVEEAAEHDLKRIAEEKKNLLTMRVAERNKRRAELEQEEKAVKERKTKQMGDINQRIGSERRKKSSRLRDRLKKRKAKAQGAGEEAAKETALSAEEEKLLAELDDLIGEHSAVQDELEIMSTGFEKDKDALVNALDMEGTRQKNKLKNRLARRKARKKKQEI